MSKSMDPDYKLYLKHNNTFQVTNADTDKNEPQYEIFLNSLKQDGNVWVVVADERNGLPENHRMEDLSDDAFDRDTRRETMNVIVEIAEDDLSNFCNPDVGRFCKNQRKGMVENGITLPINPQPFQVEQNLNEDRDMALSNTSSMHRNNERLGSAKKRIVKDVRTSAKVIKGGECEASRNVVDVDCDYQVYLKNFINDKDGDLHPMDVLGTHSSEGNLKPMAVPGRSDGDEDDGCICLDNPSGEGNSLFRKQLMKILRKPYNKKERRRLARDMKASTPVKRNLDLRHGREQSYVTNKNGKSYLDYYPDLRRKLEAASCHKELILLRGFFFWLQNLTQPGAFRPWLDKSCLAVQPEDC